MRKHSTLVILLGVLFVGACSPGRYADRAIYTCLTDDADGDKLLEVLSDFGAKYDLNVYDRGHEAKKEALLIGVTNAYHEGQRPLLGLLRKHKYIGWRPVAFATTQTRGAILLSYFYNEKYNQEFSTDLEERLTEFGFSVVTEEKYCTSFNHGNN